MKIQKSGTPNNMPAKMIAIFILALLVRVSCAETPTSPPGTFTTSWLGNTFMNTSGSQVVTELLNDICVSPNGIVFTAGYAETGGGGASFNALDGSFAGRYQGSNSGFGDPLSCVAADNNYVYYGCNRGILRAAHGGTNGGYTEFKTGGTNVSGLFIKGDKLYTSDADGNKIHVLKLSDMTEITSWACANPRHLTVDHNDNVWVVIYDPASSGGAMVWGLKVVSFSETGVPGPEINNIVKPTTVSVDNAGLLLIGGLNEQSQIMKYDVSSTPVVVDSFGTYKGIFGGKKPGAFTDSAKLHWIRSIAVDADNNIYTGNGYGTFWGGCIEKWTPAGKLLWRDFAGTSLDCGGIDPENETEVYSKFHHYSLDYSQSTPGSEWSLKGFTVDRFKYPNDYRVDHLTDVGERSLGAGVYRIGGKLFISRSSQNGYRCEFFRQDTTSDGEVMVPSVHMASGDDAQNQFYNPMTKSWFGKDKKDNLYVYGSWCVANNGDLVTVCPGNVVQYKFGGFDAYDNPLWEAANANTIPYPESMPVCRMHYDSDSDVMYLAGDFPNGDDYGSFLHIKRFNNWSKGNRVSSYTVTLPYQDQAYVPDLQFDGGAPISFRVEGDYMFILYGYGYIRILNKSNGNIVGTLKQDVNGYKGSAGQVDAHFGLNVHKRANGQYILLYENAGWANIMMIRWCPDGNCPEVNWPVDSVQLHPDTLQIDGSGTGMLKATLFPSNASNKNVSWTSSNPKVAKAAGSLSAIVTGLTPGTTTIYVTTQDGQKTDSATVIIKSVAVDGITLTPSSTNLKVGAKTTLAATVTPTNASNKTIDWSSDNPSIASVDSMGKVTAISVGQTKITALTIDGSKSAECIISVTPISDIDISLLSKLSVYPNPFKNELFISEKVDEIAVYGIDGVLLQSVNNTNQINTSDLSNGIYIIRIQNTGYHRLLKLMKE